MVELDQIKSELGNLAGPLAELESSLGVGQKEQRIEELLEAVEKVCPMYNLFKDGPQIFEARIVRTGKNKK